MAANELVIPERNDHESNTDFFIRVVRRTLADYGDSSFVSTQQSKNIEACRFEAVASLCLFYTSVDTTSGIETVGIAIQNHKVSRPNGADYQALTTSRHTRLMTIFMRNYFLREGIPLLTRHDHIGGALLQRTLINETSEEFHDDQIIAVRTELESDLSALRQGWRVLSTPVSQFPHTEL